MSKKVISWWSGVNDLDDRKTSESEINFEEDNQLDIFDAGA